MMARAMRRARQELPHEEAVALLERATSGVLAVAGDDGYPYAVPLSFAYVDGTAGTCDESAASGGEPTGEVLPSDVVSRPASVGALYFHCAPVGHKLDAIARSDKASFAVIGTDEVLSEQFTTRYRSAIAFGRVRVADTDEERMRALRLLAAKYLPGLDEGFRHEIETSYARTCVLVMDVERLSGKEGIEFTRLRRACEPR